MADFSPRTALVIGASRGLGLEMAAELLRRGWQVAATVRGTNRTALHALAETEVGDRLQIETVDINLPEQITELRERLRDRHFDVLFVNAGIANDPATPIGEVSTAEFIDVMQTNALGPMRAIEALGHLVPAYGIIGAMSSGLGSIADNTSGGWELYRASKAALNMLMCSYALRNPGDARSYLLMTPGWVRTDMGGPNATLSAEESITGVVDTIIREAGTPGLRYLSYRGEPVPW